MKAWWPGGKILVRNEKNFNGGFIKKKSIKTGYGISGMKYKFKSLRGNCNSIQKIEVAGYPTNLL